MRASTKETLNRAKKLESFGLKNLTKFILGFWKKECIMEMGASKLNSQSMKGSLKMVRKMGLVRNFSPKLESN